MSKLITHAFFLLCLLVSSNAFSAPAMTFSVSADVATADPGDPITYTLEYANLGDSDAYSVVITNTIPALTSFVSAVPAYDSVSGDNYEWNMGLVAAGGSGSIIITTTVDAYTEANTLLSNNAMLEYKDSNNNGLPTLYGHADVTVSAPIMTVSLTSDLAQTTTGGRFTYSINYQNLGTGSAADSVITLALPANATLVSTIPMYTAYIGSQLTWSMGTVTGGASGTILVEMLADAVSCGATQELPANVVLNYNDSNENPMPQEEDSHSLLLVGNTPPIAHAGLDQTVHQGDVVTLDGSGSSDEEGNYPLSYNWLMLSSPANSVASLNDSQAIQPVFTADTTGDFEFQLTVADTAGCTSLTDTVVISTTNTAPVADPGSDLVASVLGEALTLDGSASYDTDGDTLAAYQWYVSDLSIPADSYQLTNANQAVATFIPLAQHSFPVCLQVTDSLGAISSNSDHCITISFNNIQPVADAGGNQSVIVGDLVTLSASGSSDPNLDPLSYEWSMASQPAGSIATLNATNEVETQFTPDVEGSYIVALQVSDGLLSNHTTVTVQATTAASNLVNTLNGVTEAINQLTPADLMNKNLAHTLTNKINAVLALVEEGDYASALNKLRNDIQPKTNGCATSGAPDKNDWIRNCAAQETVYNPVIGAISILATE